jgi:uncharacterized protein (DUF433 family)
MTTTYLYKNIITLEQGKRNSKPCIRGMRITVEDVLRWLASGMTTEEIITDFPELTPADIFAVLDFSANRQQRFAIAS